MKGIAALSAGLLLLLAHAAQGRDAAPLVCPAGTRLTTVKVRGEGIDACRDARGRLQGPWRRTSLEGQTIELGTYQGGQKHGRWQRWSSDGRLVLIEEHSRGVRHGPWISYFPEPAREGTGSSSDLDVLHRPMLPVSDETRGTFVRGLRQGLFVTRSPSGNILSRGWYLAGRRHGRWEAWDEAKRKTWEADYDNGQLIRPHRPTRALVREALRQLHRNLRRCWPRAKAEQVKVRLEWSNDGRLRSIRTPGIDSTSERKTCLERAAAATVLPRYLEARPFSVEISLSL